MEYMVYYANFANVNSMGRTRLGTKSGPLGECHFGPHRLYALSPQVVVVVGHELSDELLRWLLSRADENLNSL